MKKLMAQTSDASTRADPAHHHDRGGTDGSNGDWDASGAGPSQGGSTQGNQPSRGASSKSPDAAPKEGDSSAPPRKPQTQQEALDMYYEMGDAAWTAYMGRLDAKTRVATKDSLRHWTQLFPKVEFEKHVEATEAETRNRQGSQNLKQIRLTFDIIQDLRRQLEYFDDPQRAEAHQSVSPLLNRLTGGERNLHFEVHNLLRNWGYERCEDPHGQLKWIPQWPTAKKHLITQLQRLRKSLWDDRERADKLHDPDEVRKRRNEWVDDFATDLRDDILAWQEDHDADSMPTRGQDKEVQFKHHQYYTRHAKALTKRAENSFGPEGAVANSFGELWRSDAERNRMFQIPGYHERREKSAMETYTPAPTLLQTRC